MLVVVSPDCGVAGDVLKSRPYTFSSELKLDQMLKTSNNEGIKDQILDSSCQIYFLRCKVSRSGTRNWTFFHLTFLQYLNYFDKFDEDEQTLRLTDQSWHLKESQ